MIDLTPILGAEFYTIVEDTLGNGHVIYNGLFIITSIFFLMSWKAVLTWITILIKAGFRQRGD